MAAVRSSWGRDLYPWLVTFVVLMVLDGGAMTGAMFCDSQCGNCTTSPVTLTVHPASPKVGQKIWFECVVNPEFRDEIDPSRLTIRKKTIHYNTSLEYVVASETGITLTIKNADYDTWHGHLSCEVYNYHFDCVNFQELHKQSAIVSFRRDPKPISFTSCVVHNWERLRCDWSPSWAEQKTHTLVSHVDHNFTYSLVYNRVDLPREQRTCVLKTNESCELTAGSTDRDRNTFVMGDTYRLMVHGTTEHNFSLSHYWKDQFGESFDTSKHVLPDPPSALTHTEVDSHTTLVSWSPPLTSWTQAADWTLRYNVTVTNSWDQNVTTMSTTNKSVSLGTHPYTTYTISITATPDHGGYTSLPANYSLTTAQTVPVAIPQVSPVSYERLEDGKVRLYWKPLHPWQQGSDNFEYLLLTKQTDDDIDDSEDSREKRDAKTANNTTNWSENHTTANRRPAYHTIGFVPGASNYTTVLALLPEEHTGLRVTVGTRNALGRGPVDPGMTVDVKVTVSILSERVIIEGDNATIHLTLKGAVPGAQYVVFWQPKDGTGPVDWHTLPTPSPGAHTPPPVKTTPSLQPDSRVVLPGPYADYKYGLARVDADGGNTGITGWEIHPHTYHGVAPPVAAVSTTPEQRRLTVEWSAPPSVEAVIQYYRVHYCVCEGEACTAGHFTHHHTVLGDQHRTTLTGLDPGTRYCVTVTSHTRDGESRPSPVTTAVTNKALGVAVIGGIVAAGVVVLILLGVGVYACYRKCAKVKNWYTSGLKVEIPEPQTAESASSDTPFLHYSFHQNSKYRDPYHRTLSSMSNTSVDSGQFSLALDDHDDAQSNTSSTNGMIHSYTRTYLSSPTQLRPIPEDTDHSHGDDVFTYSQPKFVETYQVVVPDHLSSGGRVAVIGNSGPNLHAAPSRNTSGSSEQSSIPNYTAIALEQSRSTDDLIEDGTSQHPMAMFKKGAKNGEEKGGNQNGSSGDSACVYTKIQAQKSSKLSNPFKNKFYRSRKGSGKQAASDYVSHQDIVKGAKSKKKSPVVLTEYLPNDSLSRPQPAISGYVRNDGSFDPKTSNAASKPVMDGYVANDGSFAAATPKVMPQMGYVANDGTFLPGAESTKTVPPSSMIAGYVANDGSFAPRNATESHKTVPLPIGYVANDGSFSAVPNTDSNQEKTVQSIGYVANDGSFALSDMGNSMVSMNKDSVGYVPNNGTFLPAQNEENSTGETKNNPDIRLSATAGSGYVQNNGTFTNNSGYLPKDALFSADSRESSPDGPMSTSSLSCSVSEQSVHSGATDELPLVPRATSLSLLPGHGLMRLGGKRNDPRPLSMPVVKSQTEDYTTVDSVATHPSAASSVSHITPYTALHTGSQSSSAGDFNSSSTDTVSDSAESGRHSDISDTSHVNMSVMPSDGYVTLPTTAKTPTHCDNSGYRQIGPSGYVLPPSSHDNNNVTKQPYATTGDNSATHLSGAELNQFSS